MDQKPMPERERFAPPEDITQKKRFSKIKKYLKKRPPKKRLISVAGVSLFVLLIGAYAAFSFIEPTETLNPEPEVVSNYIPPPPEFFSPLTGIMTDENSSKRPVTAVMIENSIDARPQAGLYDAGIVFEAIAEGGITRFMALFQESQPENIGPIRSARPYYVEWAKAFDAAYVHSGGSPEALGLIRDLGVKDLDHGNYGNALADRVSSRFAPHNVFTSMAKIDSVRQGAGFTTSDFPAYERKEDAPAITPTATSIAFNISGANYNTSYTYVAESNTYRRTMAGLPHNDLNSGKQIDPKVVVALNTTYGIHPNGIHSVYGTTGSGAVQVFQDGTVTEGTWSRASAGSPLLFLDSAGNPMTFNAGQMWITAIQSDRVSY